jgi:hypothetical protein
MIKEDLPDICKQIPDPKIIRMQQPHHSINKQLNNNRPGNDPLKQQASME